MKMGFMELENEPNPMIFCKTALIRSAMERASRCNLLGSQDNRERVSVLMKGAILRKKEGAIGGAARSLSRLSILYLSYSYLLSISYLIPVSYLVSLIPLLLCLLSLTKVLEMPERATFGSRTHCLMSDVSHLDLI